MTEPIDETAAYAAAYRWALGRHLYQLRELGCAIATARLVGADDSAAVRAYEDYLGDLPEEMVPDLLSQAVWSGGRSVEREARTRLIRLRDAVDVSSLEEVPR